MLRRGPEASGTSPISPVAVVATEERESELTRAGLLRFVLLVGIMGASLAGCTQPNPTTAAGRSDIAGQKCALCMAENPGDYDTCHAICVQRVEDEAAYLKAIGR